MHLFVAILENGRHLGFSIYQSDRIYLITIEMSHTNVGACITIGTIHKMTYLLHCKSVTTCPNGNAYNMPQRHLDHEICNYRKNTVYLHLATYTQGSVYSHNHEQVYIHNIY